MDQELIKIQSLIVLHLEGSLGEADRLVLEQWKAAHPDNRQLFEELTDTENLEMELRRLRSVNVDAALERFKQVHNMEVAPVETPRMHFLRRWQWAAAAAAIILLATTTLFLILSDRSGKPKSLAHTSEIQPGKSGAILTLADGSQVLLDSIRDSVVALQGGATAKIVGGALYYESSGNEVVYNTMSTPTGRQYHLTLPDGTVVWLNSLSSIRFPTVFAGSERLVEITGEAYFEVAKNKEMPFRVKINRHADVTVLGTSFNINAYQDEQMIKTTLLEGLVRVKSGVDSLQLRPGEQTQIRPSGGISKTFAIQDMDEVVAWKNGLFSFNNTGLEEVTRQLKRWYGIDVKFEGPVPDKIFRGELDRGVRLDAVLNWLTELGVKNRMDGNTLVISNK